MRDNLSRKYGTLNHQIDIHLGINGWTIINRMAQHHNNGARRKQAEKHRFRTIS